jgi:putative aminopeptidase FrvX
VEILEKLTATFGVSGRESEINQVITDLVKDHVDRVMTDGIDNVIAVKNGYGKDKKKIMVSAHKDEIGFMVMYIDSDGYIYLRPVGGIPVSVSIGNRIIFRNGTVGVLCFKKDVESIKNNNVGDMFADIGAKNKEDAMNYVKPGDMGSYYGPLCMLKNDRVVAKALDNRIGCYVAIKALTENTEPYNDMYYVFTSQEELGLKGAIVASRVVQPEIAVAVDVTSSFDTPITKEGNAVLGGGAAIKVMDRSVICDESLIGIMQDICKKNDIANQSDILAAGGTDAGAIYTSNQGVRTGGISIPMRYVHGPVGMVDMNDVKACIELLKGFANQKI